jgi:nucleoside-diphosphate-sugar epimerase
VNINIAPDDPDRRDYNVSFAKAQRVLGYEARVSVEDGVREIYDALKYGSVEFTPKTSDS